MPEVSLANKNHTQVINNYRLIMKENETRIEEAESDKFEGAEMKFNIIPFRNLHV